VYITRELRREKEREMEWDLTSSSEQMKEAKSEIGSRVE
jgi:hypothetical protein